MNKLLLLSSCALVVILINLWVRYNIMNAELSIGTDSILYKTEYLFAVINLCDLDSVSLKKSILGEKLVLIGSFSIDLKNFGKQKRKVLEIHKSKNFDIYHVYDFLKENIRPIMQTVE